MARLHATTRLPDSAETWRDHKALIKDLLSIYEARIRDLLGLRKKLKKDDWLSIWLHCRTLQDSGELPDIVWNQDHIPWSKAWKEIRRHGYHKMRPNLAGFSLPQGISIIPAQMPLGVAPGSSDDTHSPVSPAASSCPLIAQASTSSNGSHIVANIREIVPVRYLLSDLMDPGIGLGRPPALSTFQLLVKAVYELSNFLIDVDDPTYSDWTLHAKLFAHLHASIYAALSATEQPTVKLAMRRLVYVTICMDDVRAFTIMSIHKLHPVLSNSPAMIKLLVQRKAQRCLGCYLLSMQPTQASVEVVIQAAVISADIGLTNSLIQWLNVSLNTEELLCQARECIADILDNPISHSTSLWGDTIQRITLLDKQILKAVLGHQVARERSIAIIPDCSLRELNNRDLLHQLLIDYGRILLDHVNSQHHFPTEDQPAHPGTAMYTSLRTYEEAVFELLSCGSQLDDPELWIATFLGATFPWAHIPRADPSGNSILGGAVLLIHAVWHLKALGPRVGIMSCIHWLQGTGVTFGQLSIAAAVSRTDEVHALNHIKSLGADIHKHGGRALATAASNLGEATVQWLLGHGVSLDATIDNEQTITAVAGTNLELRDKVRKHLPIPQIYMEPHLTAPRLTASEASQRLLKLGAHMRRSPTDEDPMVFLEHLVEHSSSHSPGAWQDLLSQADLTGPRCLSTLHRCIEKRSWDWLEAMIAHGATVDTTIFAHALENEPPAAALDVLLRTGVRVSEDIGPWSIAVDEPIASACKIWHLGIVRQFEAEGGDLLRPLRRGGTLLGMASKFRPRTLSERQRRNYLVHRLLKSGVDINFQTDQTPTALHYAAANGDLELAIILLDNDASCDPVGRSPDRNGGHMVGTALDFAVLYGRLDVVQLLLNEGAKSGNPGLSGYDGTIHHAQGQAEGHMLQLIQQFAGIGVLLS
ncbi:hypothetical protein Micbo1qcDRAFT_176329 [Microdochium bolleyi]|uniref:Uncharacterized protein n=1 Tax=Microdochium bolleyi TaxID=196109 RepID=A0A136J0M5_9PEZI|nr:hypothetical protein Micbo1qcDRAFT_176329 [Microdochium bolleyi]